VTIGTVDLAWERNRLRPSRIVTRKLPEISPLEEPARAGFRPGTKASENVSCQVVGPHFHEEPTDHAIADARPSRARRRVGLDDLLPVNEIVIEVC
jgi:hypothetical protein